MTAFIDNKGVAREVVKLGDYLEEEFWMAEFTVIDNGQAATKSHYCNDYKTLREFVEMSIKYYNEDLLAEGVAEKDLDSMLIKEVSPDYWDSQNIKAVIRRTGDTMKKVIATKQKAKRKK
jgi:hypothetical protein